LSTDAERQADEPTIGDEVGREYRPRTYAYCFRIEAYV